MATTTIYVPRALGGTLVLVIVPTPPSIQFTWQTRDLQANWKTRDLQATWQTRDEQATWKARG